MWMEPVALARGELDRDVEPPVHDGLLELADRKIPLGERDTERLGVRVRRGIAAVTIDDSSFEDELNDVVVAPDASEAEQTKEDRAAKHAGRLRHGWEPSK